MKLSGYLIVGLFLVLLIGCSFKNPEMPTWDVTVDLPLLNDYWYVSDLVDSVHFFQNGNEMYFSSNGNINSFHLNDLNLHTNSNIFVPLESGMPTYNGSIPLNTVNPDEDSIKVAYGLIQSGSLKIVKSSVTQNFGSADIIFNELSNQNGNLHVHITDSSPNTIYIDLSGLSLGSEENTSTIDLMHFSVAANSTLPTGTLMCNVNMILDQDISFVEFHGTIERRFLLDIINDTSDINIDYPLGIENAVQIHNASLQLDLMNEIGFDCEFFGTLYAFNDSTGQSAAIDIRDAEGNPFVIRAAHSETEPTLNTFILDNNNGLNELTNIIPTRFYVRNSYFKLMTSNAALGFAKVGEKVTGSYIEKVPFNFTLNESWITPTRLDSLEINSDNRDKIRKNLNDASLIMKIKNQLPVGMEAQIYFSSNPDVLHHPQLMRSANVLSGGYDSAFQEIPLALSHDDLLVFDVPKIYYKIKVNIHATNGPVSITASSSDYIEFIGRIKMNVKVEED
ncbi:MAG TPA: hypothetical protein PLE74_02480 [Candidatus Cloacimonadota bacterium]|nr:hypothetical protein [Candidatus Cloacimonadota bacterium]HPT71130.1 hypothetical protein [Candidatus Cloacimonadota bacterium]